MAKAAVSTWMLGSLEERGALNEEGEETNKSDKESDSGGI